MHRSRVAAEPQRWSRSQLGRCCLQKSVPSCYARFSWVVLPLTKAHERLVGRSERPKFSPAARQRHAATFSTSATKGHSSAPFFGRSGGGSVQQATIRFTTTNVASLAVRYPEGVEGGERLLSGLMDVRGRPERVTSVRCTKPSSPSYGFQARDVKLTSNVAFATPGRGRGLR